jgi:hypothetical protein
VACLHQFGSSDITLAVLDLLPIFAMLKLRLRALAASRQHVLVISSPPVRAYSDNGASSVPYQRDPSALGQVDNASAKPRRESPRPETVRDGFRLIDWSLGEQALSVEHRGFGHNSMGKREQCIYDNKMNTIGLQG